MFCQQDMGRFIVEEIDQYDVKLPLLNWLQALRQRYAACGKLKGSVWFRSMTWLWGFRRINCPLWRQSGNLAYLYRLSGLLMAWEILAVQFLGSYLISFPSLKKVSLGEFIGPGWQNFEMNTVLLSRNEYGRSFFFRQLR